MQHKILATLLTIGDEILIGQTVDTNSAWMGMELNKVGIKVHEIITVSDTAEHIKEAVHKGFQTSDIVLTTGGLGPTKDDVTKKTLADYFGVKLVFQPEILIELETYFTKRGLPLLESTKSLALLPENCEVIRNRRGTAAAMWFEHKEKVLVSMPGVPYEMKDFMEHVVLRRLVKQFNGPTIIHKTLMVAGLGETVIAEKIKAVEDALPTHIKLAYLPNMAIVKLRLSAMGEDQEKLRKEVELIAQQLKDILYPKYIFSDEQVDFAAHIGQLLVAKKATVGLAESCTGGLIAHRLTSNAGSSAYFKGGIVAYSNALKQNLLGVKATTLAERGAVSEQTVREMVAGVLQKMETDYAVAVSGIAGPGGGTAEKPVGTIWVAVGNQEKIIAKKYQFARDRAINIGLTTTFALVQLRRLILGIDV